MATSPNSTQITPPRVPLTDERTGAVSREWYRWFYSLYDIVGTGTGIIPVTSGGTGLSTIPTNGQLLIGNGTGYTLNTLTPSSGITVTNAIGTITIANSGVLSNVAGTGISVSGATGNVTISNTGVLSFSGGSTGLTPATATTGAVTLAGTLGIANGGTNGSATPTAYGVAYGTGAAYAFTAAGTTGQVLTATTGGAPTWAAPATSGTVTSVSFTGGLITIATPTTTPALTVAGTSGGVVYFSSASTWASSAALAANALVVGGGAGVAPSTVTTGAGVVTALGVNTGSAGAFVVNGGALGTPSSGTVTNLTGTASININGTVGATTANTGAFTDLSYTGTLTGSTGIIAIGTSQFYKDASGNVGLGTASPAGSFVVTGSSQGFGNNLATSNPTGGAFSFVDPNAATILNIVRMGKDNTTTPAGVTDVQIIAYGSSNNTGGGNLRFINSRYALETGLIKSARESTNGGYLAFYTQPIGGAGLVQQLSISSTGNVVVTGAGGLGYGTGSGGTVTQATSRTTGVTLNKTNGAITLVSAAGLATFQSFTVTNSTVAATDVVHVTQKSGTDLYQIFVTATAAGSFRITFATTGGTTVEQPVLNFAVIKGVTA